MTDTQRKMPRIKTGIGYDVHRLIPSETQQIILGGIAMPSAFKLEGHSDADVLLHAITDAILGAICAQDIGTHFKPSDPKWAGANSEIFLRHAHQLLKDQRAYISHIDTVIIAEQPKISPHREAIRKNIAHILEINLDQISVKATTTERLGFTGRQEGIAAQALVTIYQEPREAH